MANEIRLSLGVEITKGYLSYSFNPGQINVDLTTARRGGHIQTIGLTEEDIDVGDVTSPGLCILRNLDTTNYVTIGPKVGTTNLIEPIIKLKPGQPAVLFLDPTVTLVAIANAGAVSLQVDVFEV